MTGLILKAALLSEIWYIYMDNTFVSSTSSDELNSGSPHPSVYLVQIFYKRDKSTQTHLINSCVHRDVLHIKITDKFDIDLCVTFLDFWLFGY